MTLKEIYISKCEEKLKNGELYLPDYNISDLNDIKNIEFVSYEYELIYGNILLSKNPLPKKIKEKTKPDSKFINIIKEKYQKNLCSCHKEGSGTFRSAIQNAWLYLLIDSAIISLETDFSKLGEILNDYLENDIKNARTTQTEVIHLLTDFLCKYKLYKAVEKVNFINPSPKTDFFNCNTLLSQIAKGCF